MPILHQVALRTDDEPAWENLRIACAAGDTVVLLDTAVAAGFELAQCNGLRICVPRDELADSYSFPATIELIDDHQWWQLVAD